MSRKKTLHITTTNSASWGTDALREWVLKVRIFHYQFYCDCDKHGQAVLLFSRHIQELKPKHRPPDINYPMHFVEQTPPAARHRAPFLLRALHFVPPLGPQTAAPPGIAIRWMHQYLPLEGSKWPPPTPIGAV